MAVYYPRAVIRFLFQLDRRVDALVAALLPPGWEKFAQAAGSVVNAAAASNGVLQGDYMVDVVPQRLRVKCNSYHEADEAFATIDFARFPFDPRIAKAVTMQIHMGAVGSVDEKLKLSKKTLLFTGYVDEGDWQQDDDSTIKFDARDQTALIHGRPFSGQQVDVTKPLIEVIQAILQEHPSTAPMKVEARGVDGSIVIADFKGDIGGQKHSGETTQSAWEVITHLCIEVGWICWVEQDTVVIAESQALIGIKGPKFIYGQNLKEIGVKRQVGWAKAAPITVRSWNPVERKTISATWPKEMKPEVQGDGKPKPPDANLYCLSNVKDVAALERAARCIWVRRQSQDICLDFTTAEMKGIDNEELLQLRAGMPIQVLFTRAEEQFLYGKTLGEATRYLLGQGYRPGVAAAIAGAYQDITALYQVDTAEHSFDEQKGYQLRVKAASYIQAQ
ncbi:hypothetical protein IT570_03480 [Candidatus Sumerlaeota bacterium]|nr:hypothetical protein [Candidatus Sumerlaeota bacterium]